MPWYSLRKNLDETITNDITKLKPQPSHLKDHILSIMLLSLI